MKFEMLVTYSETMEFWEDIENADTLEQALKEAERIVKAFNTVEKSRYGSRAFQRKVLIVREKS